MTGLFPHKKHREICPECGGELHIRQSKKGLFLGCTRYPDCQFLQPLTTQHESKVLKVLEQACPKCGELLVLRHGQFGMFIACGNYPQCHYVVQQKATENTVSKEVACPECRKGILKARLNRYGKTFYGCENYPKCKFTLNADPMDVPCPHCGFAVSILKKQTETSQIYQCTNRHCQQRFEVENAS